MFEKVVPVGGNMGVPFDDGVFDGVKKIIIGKDSECLAFIKIEYEKDEKYQTVVHGTIRGGLVSQEFWIEYPNEYITSVGGTYDHVPSQGTVVIKSLIFTTSYRRTCPVLGVPGGKQFLLEGPTGGKLLGFHGRSSRAINSMGAYFFGVSPPLKHFSRQGGNGGSVWDDGAYDGVRRINVSLGGRFVAYCRFEYARGERMVPHAHGKLQNHPQPFVVDYPNEEIISVEGTIDVHLTSLRFKTSKGRTSPTFGSVVGRRFVFEENGFKLVGFCGRSADFIDALGAHFAPFSPLTPATTPPSSSAPVHAPTSTPTPATAPSPIPAPAPTPGSTVGTGSTVGGSGVDTSGGGVHKLEARGGQGGKQWDDGADFEGVINIYVASGGRGIENIRFDYVKNGETKKGPLRSVQSRGVISTIAINHPEEYLESVEGWYDSSNIIQGIKFQTNKKNSDDIGYVFDGDGRKFSLKVKDKKIIGFHGFADSNLNSLGAYFVPISSSSAPISSSSGPSPNKLEAQGGNGGDIFDDGSFDDIRKVYVGQGESSVAYIRFEYEKNGKIETREHGKRTLLGTEEFEVGQDDYITSVEVYYEKIFGMPSEIITSLIFNTFKGKTSQPFGLVSGNKTMLQGGKGKIVGFHGRASHVLHALGIYISPLV